MSASYKELYAGGQGEIVEKKSRFIATTYPAKTEGEALGFIESMRKKYWDARHNCFAYVIGERGELKRCSDDGEPGGTAGRPMLDVLLGEEIRNITVVVTRYFGGTLLGTGGLVRAYSSAVQSGLASSVIITRISGFKLYIGTDYTSLGKIQYTLAGKDIKILDSAYTDKVTLTALVPAGELEAVKAAVTEAANGRVSLTEGGPVSFAMIDGAPVIL
ncbi:MAG: YigZ family protein [Lachnospiraceae bacterium]